MTDDDATRAATTDEDAVSHAARRCTIDETLRRSAARSPEKCALIAGDARWTYAMLDQRVDRIAAGLIGAGVRPGDRIALLSRNSHWYVALRYAVSRAGAVFVPVNFMLSTDEVAYILNHSGAGRLFVDPSCASVGTAAAERSNVTSVYGIPDLTEAQPSAPSIQAFDDILATSEAWVESVDQPIAQIIYTSGTESRPKGAVLTHAAILWQYQSCIVTCDWRADAVVANALPLFHCAQLDAFLGPSLQIGATNVILASPAADVLLPAIKQHSITSVFAPPTVWIDLLRSPAFDAQDLTSVTHGYYGASIMPRAVLEELMSRLPTLRLWNCYGQTEIAPVATVLEPQDQLRKAGSVGRAVLHVETRVVDDAMHPVAVGEVGEIVHRSPQLLSHYWNDPQRSAEAFAGGWFHSGDLATIDDEGFITVVDRKKDMIKSGGENVSSREVEEEIYRLAGVSEVAVVGLPDQRLIEMVACFVVAKTGATIGEEAVIRHCRMSLAGFKTPKRVFIVDALPRNASGKVLKRELRQSVTPAS